MADARTHAVESMLREAARLHEQASVEAAGPVVAAADVITSALRAGGKVLVFGNGGSAADAQHLACELVGRFLRDRQALAAIALTTDAATMTAVANDFGFERIFVRQLEALARPGDVAVAISTSGTSKNVLAAVAYARTCGLKTVAFTGGTGGALAAAADVSVNVSNDRTPRIQEVHRTLIHAVCDLVESEMAGREGQA